MSDLTAATGNEADRHFPPIAWLSSLALGLVVIGGIVMASYAPRLAPLKAATALLVAAIVLLLGAVGLLFRIPEFAWARFLKVFKWSLLAYIIEAGMIEFVFVKDQMRGSSLLIVTLMLVVFATSVPVTIAFTTARYAEVGDE
ncbi:MAG TPA: hypothetical protein VMV53_02060 [Acidimicrobiales bacterium]|nr:hypothetical protein [Acidimicrobiales bacterium]